MTGSQPIADLTGRSALITGAASGLGKAMAHALASAGAHVTVADLNGEAAREVAAAIEGEAWEVDLSDTDALDGTRIDTDILINNVGIQRIHAVEDFPLDDWRLINRLMLESPFVLTKAVLPGMYERGWGRIVNVRRFTVCVLQRSRARTLPLSMGSWA